MKRFALFFAFLVFVGLPMLQAQTVQITGAVTSSEDGKGVPGVSVVVKGTTVGTTTDFDGKYTLNVPSGATTLVYSFVGLKSQEAAIGGRNSIDVVLESDVVGLSEVVVLGYTTKGKNQITGSTVQVKGDNLRDVPVTSIDQVLQGKVPGLAISASSGTPGSVQDIRIRGVGSITASNEPLFVIDGVPVINSNFTADDDVYSSFSALSSFNSSDIESVTVLKDASATAAYGARGSNGVIVITTKKGSAGKTKFLASATFGFQNDAVQGLKPLTGDQKSELFLESVYNTYGTKYGFTKDGAYDFVADNDLDDGALQNWNGKSTNWGDLVTNKDALVQNYDVSATGGDDLSSFYASLGYNKTEAITIGSDFKRISGKLSYTRKFFKNVEFSTNSTVANSIQNGILEQSAYYSNPRMAKYFMSPWEQAYNEDGSINTDVNSSVFNPLYTLKNDMNKTNLTRLMNNSSLNWTIVKNLKFKTLFSIDYSISTFHGYRNRVHGDGASSKGNAEEYDQRNLNWVTQNSLSYSLSHGGHNLDAMVLMEFQKNKYNDIDAYGENFPADGLKYVSSASANYTASTTFTDWKNLSYLGMLNYNYLSKYIVDFTYRLEGSSKFAPGLRFGSFGSVGVAWNLNQEAFLSDVTFINNLRLRGSYGLSGNSGIDVNEYQALLSYDANYNDEGAVYPSQFGNADLTWEKNRTLDVGIDYAILNNRISGSLAYYHKTTFDLLQDVPLSRTTGHASQYQNVGTMLNKGIEITINFNIVKSKDFNFNIGANLATVKNKVTELAKSTNGEDITIATSTRKVEVGHPVYSWYMREWAGVNPENGNAQWYVNGKGSEITENYYDANQVYVGGSALPTYTGGVDLHADYKGLFFDLNLYFSGGNKVFEDWSSYTHNSGYLSTLYYNGVETMMDRWQQAGDVTDVPKVIYGSNNDSRTSTRFLFNNDYIRVKGVALGYNIPTSVANKAKLAGITIFARGTNLFTWVKDDGLKYDPEVGADGFTMFTTPPVKSVIFGINLKF
jgi:TonB-dependent starch-binding outer membrane protein SusC